MTLDRFAVDLPHIQHHAWPTHPLAHREWAAEILIRTLHDTEDPALFDVLRALVRPDLGALDMIEHVEALCQLSQDVAETEQAGAREAWECLADEYAEALSRFVTRPVDDVMTLVRVVAPGVAAVRDELAQRRGAR